jgi:hypothetical protein
MIYKRKSGNFSVAWLFGYVIFTMLYQLLTLWQDELGGL